MGGKAPVVIAARQGYYSMVTLLLTAGAYPHPAIGPYLNEAKKKNEANKKVPILGASPRRCRDEAIAQSLIVISERALPIDQKKYQEWEASEKTKFREAINIFNIAKNGKLLVHPESGHPGIITNHDVGIHEKEQRQRQRRIPVPQPRYSLMGNSTISMAEQSGEDTLCGPMNSLLSGNK